MSACKTMDGNLSDGPTQLDSSLSASQALDEPQPTTVPQGYKVRLKKLVLAVVGVSVALQAFSIATKSMSLHPFRLSNFSTEKEKPYNVLIFGAKQHLSQRLDFLEETGGVWKHEFTCGRGTKMVVRVGEDESDFTGKDAVVFNMDEAADVRDIDMLVSMPESHNQAWIYYGMEPAARMRWEFKKSNGSLPLHGVWSFHRAAEVQMRYGYFVAGEPATNDSQTMDGWLRGKTKLVAWMVRNCYTTFWPRYEYVTSLQEHIPVDIYGACGPLDCPFGPRADCIMILKQYKFYLALESAECDDYATEKLWENAYMYGLLPVVYGAQRDFYAKEAPPNSYIFAGDFNSTKYLADFLLFLDQNPREYAKYFDWRQTGHIELPKMADHSLHPGLFCPLVQFIDKVKNGGVTKRPLSEHPYYSSCAVLKDHDAGFHPKLRWKLRHWKPRG